MDDPGSDEFKRDLLKKARAAFPRFYALSTVDDRFHFDGLVFARAAAGMALIIPREPFPHEQRLAMERDSDKAERFFLLQRDRVRACATFAALDPVERGQIEQVMFELPPAPGVG